MSYMMGVLVIVLKVFIKSTKPNYSLNPVHILKHVL